MIEYILLVVAVLLVSVYFFNSGFMSQSLNSSLNSIINQINNINSQIQFTGTGTSVSTGT